MRRLRADNAFELSPWVFPRTAAASALSTPALSELRFNGRFEGGGLGLRPRVSLRTVAAVTDALSGECCSFTDDDDDGGGGSEGEDEGAMCLGGGGGGGESLSSSAEAERAEEDAEDETTDSLSESLSEESAPPPRSSSPHTYLDETSGLAEL